jgi:hypothetical protein
MAWWGKCHQCHFDLSHSFLSPTGGKKMPQ